MRDAIRVLVDHKNNLGQSIHPTGFLRAVLPFWNSAPAGEPAVQYVDPTLVIGGHFQNYPPSDDPHGLMDLLDRDALSWASSGHRGCFTAEYQQVGALELFIAHEGKNRVELYRAHRRPVAALVTPTSFPDASDLSLHELRPSKTWGLAMRSAPDDIKPLAFQEVVRPLLLAYGVKVGRPRWRFTAPFHRRTREYDACRMQLLP